MGLFGSRCTSFPTTTDSERPTLPRPAALLLLRLPSSPTVYIVLVDVFFHSRRSQFIECLPQLALPVAVAVMMVAAEGEGERRLNGSRDTTTPAAAVVIAAVLSPQLSQLAAVTLCNGSPRQQKQRPASASLFFCLPIRYLPVSPVCWLLALLARTRSGSSSSSSLLSALLLSVDLCLPHAARQSPVRRPLTNESDQVTEPINDRWPNRIANNTWPAPNRLSTN